MAVNPITAGYLNYLTSIKKSYNFDIEEIINTC